MGSIGRRRLLREVAQGTVAAKFSFVALLLIEQPEQFQSLRLFDAARRLAELFRDSPRLLASPDAIELQAAALYEQVLPCFREIFAALAEACRDGRIAAESPLQEFVQNLVSGVPELLRMSDKELVARLLA